MDRPPVHFALVVLAVLLLPLALKSGVLASEILLYGLAAAGCNLLLGYTGLLSFGQGVFFGVGSYVAGVILTRTGIGTAPVLLISAFVGALVATAIGWVSIRRQGVYFVMLTLAFSQFFYFLAYTFKDITGGDNGILDVPRPVLFGRALDSPWSMYAFVAALFLVLFAILLQITRSTLGHTLLAIRENEERAAAIGFPVKVFKVAAFAISGAVTAVAGSLDAMLIGGAPLSSIEYHTSEVILIMAIIGGRNLIASVLGSGVYLVLSDLLSDVWPRWLLLFGLFLIVVALFMQNGLWALIERVVAALAPSRSSSRRIAERAEP